MERYFMDRRCAKCDCIGASSVYINFACTPAYKFIVETGEPTETVKRICQNCGYTWHELPWDKFREPK